MSKPLGDVAKAGKRTNNPDRTAANILAVATKEFADKGLPGARIDEIADLTKTSKRMIYYYFGSKEGLYLAVLEDAYARMHGIEAGIDYQNVEPEEALKQLVMFTLDYQFKHPDFIRLVMNENILRGEFIKRSKSIQKLNIPAIDAVTQIYQQGVKKGVFRPGLDPVDLHMSISALSSFNLTNQFTFSLIFKRDMKSSKSFKHRQELAAEMVLRFVRK